MEKRGTKYRIKKQYNGTRYNLDFDHKPTQKEIQKALEDKIGQEPIIKDSFDSCAEAYSKSKSSVLSPSTIRAYEAYRKNIPEWFKTQSVGMIDTFQVQKLLNEYADNHSPKYVRNISGYVSAVIKMFCPKTILNVTLPKKKPTENYEPTTEDIKKILEASKGTMFETALWLACFGIRRSEQICLTEDDLDGNVLRIQKGRVLNDKNEWVTKDTTKTDTSYREVYLSDNVVELIHKNGFYKGHPNSIVCWLYKTEKKLGIPKFPLHYFRHYFAASMSTITDEATLLKMGGWKTDYVMKSHYRYSLNLDKAREDASKMIENLGK